MQIHALCYKGAVFQDIALLNNVKQQITQIYSWLFALFVSLLIRILLIFGSVFANVSWFDYLQNISHGTVISVYEFRVS